MELWILDGLPDHDRERVLSATRRRRFARREILFREGAPADCVHLISAGRVAVQTTTFEGDVATLNIRGRGDVVGELALIDPGVARTATVAALEETETLVLHHEQFSELRTTHPSVDRFLVAVLAAEVRRLSRLLAEALHLPVDMRVLRRLVDLSDLYASGDRDDVEIPLTQEQIASLAGTSRATVNRVLGEVEAAGLADVRRGRIVVRDRSGLRELAL